MCQRLEGKVAIITGSGSGIGRGIAHCFAREGATVIVNDINIQNARAVARELKAEGGKAIAIKADVTREKQVETMVNRVLATFSRIDILVNNAGVGGEHIGPPLTNLTGKDWDQTYSVNMKAIFLTCKAVMPHMVNQKYGKIINISSVAGKRASVNIPHYSASKAAVISFTEALATELGPYGINVNAICPGIIWTPLWERFAGQLAEQSPRLKGLGLTARGAFDAIVTQPGVRTEQMPEDIGMLAVFLASDESRRITGEAISVAGPTPVS